MQNTKKHRPTQHNPTNKANIRNTPQKIQFKTLYINISQQIIKYQIAILIFLFSMKKKRRKKEEKNYVSLCMI